MAALIALLVVAPTAAAEFVSTNANAISFEGKEKLDLTVKKGEKTEAEVTCEENAGIGYVYEKAGKTGELASEAEPASNPVEASKRVAFQVGLAECHEKVGESTKAATIESGSCQLELVESGTSILTSLRASKAKTQCATVITQGECKLEFAAKKKGENESREGWKVKTVSTEEFDLEGTLKGLTIKESGCKLGAKELEATLAVKGLLLVQELLGPETVNFGSIAVGGAGVTRMILVTARLDTLLYGVTAVLESTVFLRTADTCSGKLNVASGASCTITIRFLPLNPVLYRGRIELPANGRLPGGTPWLTTFLSTLLGTGT
jgi:hypothetical protein